MITSRFRVRHAAGTATTTPAKVSVNRGIGVYLRITNLDATNNLEVSFDNGATYHPILPASPTLEIHARFYFFKVRSSASTVEYSALICEG